MDTLKKLSRYFQPLNNTSLNEVEKDAFTKDKVLLYPERFKNINDPTLKDTLYLVSFLVNPEKDTRYIKIRGHSNTTEKAMELAKAIANDDSYFYIHIAEEGLWYPVTSQETVKSKQVVNLVDGKEIIEDEGLHKQRIEEEQHMSQRVAELKRQQTIVNTQTPDIDMLILYKIKIRDSKQQITYILQKLDLMKKRASCINKIIKKYEVTIKDNWYQHYCEALNRVGSTPYPEEDYTHLEEEELDDDLTLEDLTKELINIEYEYDRTRPT